MIFGAALSFWEAESLIIIVATAQTSVNLSGYYWETFLRVTDVSKGIAVDASAEPAPVLGESVKEILTVGGVLSEFWEHVIEHELTLTPEEEVSKRD